MTDRNAIFVHLDAEKQETAPNWRTGVRSHFSVPEMTFVFLGTPEQINLLLEAVR